ncbi:MAG: hypothetical protein QW291_02230 [Thermofilaceae archaeon]
MRTISEKFFPFLNIREDEWKVIQAVEDSLTISEVVKKSGLPPYTVSRLLSQFNVSKNVSLRFEIKLEKAGLLNIAVISKKYIEKLPYYESTRELRIMGGRYYLYVGLLPVANEVIENWLSNFEDNALVVRAVKRAWWSPKSKLTMYTNGKLYGKIPEIYLQKGEKERGPQLSLSEKNILLDDVDLLILSMKFKWPFSSMREAERESEKYFEKKVPRRVLSKHFKDHLLNLWEGNRVRVYDKLDSTPYKVIYVEGRDAYAVANTLVQLPWFHTAYIDLSKALVSGQPPCAAMPELYRALGDLDIDAIEFTMIPGIVKVTPLLYLLREVVKLQKEVEVK